VVLQTVAAAAGRVPVIAGAGSNNTATAVELARSAERAGASALLCVTPPYLKPTQAGMMVHFRTIHDAVDIPIVLYDVPSRTACAFRSRRSASMPTASSSASCRRSCPPRRKRRCGPTPHIGISPVTPPRIFPAETHSPHPEERPAGPRLEGWTTGTLPDAHAS